MKIPQNLFYIEMKLSEKNEKLCVYQKNKPMFYSKILRQIPIQQ